MEDRYNKVKNGKRKTLRDKKVAVTRSDLTHRKIAAARLINSMDLDEMLEASKLIETGIKGEKASVVRSFKAQKCAGEILRSYRRNDTKPMAEKMMHDLNVHIIKENKKTTDAAEARRLYRELMAEE